MFATTLFLLAFARLGAPPALAASINAGVYAESASGSHGDAEFADSSTGDYDAAARLRVTDPGLILTGRAWSRGRSGQARATVTKSDPGSGSIMSNAGTDEMIFTTGTGNLRMLLDYVITWDLRTDGNGAGKTARASGSLLADYDDRQFDYDILAENPVRRRMQGRTSGTLVFDVAVNDVSYYYVWSGSGTLATLAGAGIDGSIRMDSVFRIAGGPGVTAHFTDPGFVSEPPAPVPLPAGLPLAVAGVAALAALRGGAPALRPPRRAAKGGASQGCPGRGAPECLVSS
ncbi:hypothetical protein [Amaricoccus sp.]|uniref:hypothetical protein n=1 Tax=Amaricoccus sp. TaxID=1872485 RepID=UPI001B7A3C1A|nr:hypothetical protein [Amaricoccus sp.]MBP7000527.1 hypothetical protein [Amaricoccus sp.]